ncbi:lipid-A-disaccharide synthase [Planctomycetes bacterium K23_9]|uniref:Lipid-A-disaccharide synthase n=1 Tax=Stieleria marina TaxID=1930275 RepID=A0A517NNI9_9BACT|nr:Glycosyl transferase [Planctomycetes bacterium K23_9]
MPKNVFFSVGEPSGDQHAARLIERLTEHQTEIRTRGFGGQAMQAAGCDVQLDLTEHAVVGIVEVIPKLRQFFQFVDQAEEVFRSEKIDAVVLVDFPGFNWHIAKRAKKYGIEVFYYCPPQLWAWGGWRVRKMRRTVDHVLAVLPIEETFFSQHGIPTTYVGHPFFDAVQEKQLDQSLLTAMQQQCDQGDHLVAVLPGSRGHEVRQNWPIMLESIRRLTKAHPRARFQVAAYREQQMQWCRDQMTPQDESLPIDFYLGKTSEVIEGSRCAMMVSGSVSLEMMARRKPAAVIYRVGRLLYGFAKCVIGVDSMTLPNLMGPKKVYPELVSVGNPEPAVEFLCNTVHAMLKDEFYYQSSLVQLNRLSDQHAQCGATTRAAHWIADRVCPADLGVSQSVPTRNAA